MNIEPQIAIAVAVPAVLVVVWLVRLEGRINTGDSITAGLREDVTYIRQRIDQALNGHDR